MPLNIIEHVKGDVHANGLKSFLEPVELKHSIYGTYVAVEPCHLFRYVDDQAFRFNNRDMNDIQQLLCGMRHTAWKRLTCKQLTRKEDVGDET